MRARLRGDDGVTLVEMVVGMAIMMIFLGIFTVAMVGMSKSESKARSVSDTASQVNVAFLWLDRNVRYASGLTAPGTSSGDFYVELSNTGSGKQVCTQVRLHVANQQLQQRSWTVSGSSYTNLSSWLPIASNIVNTTNPFSVAATVTGSEVHQQLGISLTSTGGAASNPTTLWVMLVNTATSAQSNVTLTLNHFAAGGTAKVFQSVNGAAPTAAANATISGGQISGLTLQPSSITLLVIGH